MCGILGIVGGDNRAQIARRMLQSMHHRGPDAQDLFEHKKTALGHLRLSIIDLSTGGQPMFNYNRSKCIIYNGEIYNFLEIKDELIAKGVRFQSNSDTEVILAAYEYYGIDCLNKLNGIFAFAIYDLNTEELFLVLTEVRTSCIQQHPEGV